MKSFKLFVVIFASLIALGCGIGGTKGDLKSALDNYYSKYPAHIGLNISFICSNFPCTISNGDVSIGQLNLLSKAGLFTQKQVTDTKQLDFWGNKPTAPNAVEYSLTDLGKKYYRERVGSNPMSSEPGFIFGEIKVLDISDYSEPANQMGQIISNVKYRTKVENIASWANSDDLRANFHEIKEAFDSQITPENQEATLVKMASGWVHSDLAS